MRRLGIGIAIALVGMALPCEAAAQLLSTTFTVAQVEAGQDIYERRCATCHLDNLTGSFEAPELAGPNFRRMWNQRPVEELIDLIETTMPPGASVSLNPQDYASLVAYILRANDVEPGAVALGGFELSAPVAVTTAVAEAPETATRLFRSIPETAPVSDAMLRDPDPNDWLIYRRTYDGWGYSPLDQINSAECLDVATSVGMGHGRWT